MKRGRFLTVVPPEDEGHECSKPLPDPHNYGAGTRWQCRHGFVYELEDIFFYWKLEEGVV